MKAIMSTNIPREQKKYGHSVKDLNKPGWLKEKVLIMEKALKIKFQGKKFYTELMKTENEDIVEASPHDK